MWALTPVLREGNRFNRYSLLSTVVPVCYKTTEKGHLHQIEGTSLVAQWLRLHAPNAGGLGLIRGKGTRSHMLHAAT